MPFTKKIIPTTITKLSRLLFNALSIYLILMDTVKNCLHPLLRYKSKRPPSIHLHSNVDLSDCSLSFQPLKKVQAFLYGYCFLFWFLTYSWFIRRGSCQRYGLYISLAYSSIMALSGRERLVLNAGVVSPDPLNLFQGEKLLWRATSPAQLKWFIHICVSNNN